MKTLRLLLIFFLIQAGRCAEEALSSLLLKRSGRETPTLQSDMTEMENYAVYKKVNGIIIEVSKFQNKWDALFKTLVETKKKLGTKDVDFENIWDDWKFKTELEEECTGRDYYGRRNNCQYVLKEIKTGNCSQFVYDSDGKANVENTYKNIIKEITSPIEDFVFYINDTLKDFEPLLSTIKETITFGIKSCETKEAEVCRQKIIEWSSKEVEQYKTKLEVLKSNATEILQIVKRISDHVRKFKVEFQNGLYKKKKEYICCQKTQIEGFNSCSEMDETYKKDIFRFSKETLNYEKNIAANKHAPTTDASITATTSSTL